MKALHRSERRYWAAVAMNQLERRNAGAGR
jgi:hypothetical protein